MAEKVRKLAAAAARARPSEAAVGPQRAPGPHGLRTPEYVAAPSPGAGNRTFISDGGTGDWKGRARPTAKCGKPKDDPPGVGRCTDPCDQLYNTCPVPDDLPPGRVPALGGPVGSDPPLKAPKQLTSDEVNYAVNKGQLKRQAAAGREADGATGVNMTATYASPAAHHAEPSATHTSNASTATTEQANRLNAGDSWAIRNSNCGIAPIHGIMNRVRTGS